jgi:putative tricarboxylic transport membrane protein
MRADRLTGLFMVVLGALAAWGGSRLPPVPGQQVGPEVFPVVVGIGLVLCGLLIALGVGHQFEEEAEADLAKITSEFEADLGLAHQDMPLWRQAFVLVPPLLLVFYYLAVDRIGFLPTAAVIVFCASLALGGKVRLALPMAIAAPLFVNLIFVKLLRVPLPSGYLPLPWIGLP